MLKSFRTDINNRIDENKLDTVRATRSRFYEDGMKLLMEDAMARAQETLSRAKIEAEKIVADANGQKQEIEKQAFEKGYNDGFERGKQAAQQQYRVLWEEHLSQFILLRKQLLEQNKIYLDYLEKETLKIALYISEKILCQKIEVEPGCYLNIIKKALEKVGEDRVFIRLPEQDYEKVIALEDLSKIKNGISKINFIKDPLLSSGECIIYSDYFQMDAGIHTQVENIRSKLKEIGVIEDA
jgi:flagellar assembly protein FliH